ncbi:hypothetical protein SEA_ARCHIE_134 [Mycobacterium phage Archie]|uniref:Uncharacterized protein n=1 Tax=Mycobacterium phage Archie TaxID=1718599 RepID=A0A0M4RBQ3_9CAUD|nr:hypothetical protein AVU85_gp109 [Mycobacterium phage Archie]ALF00428.1 hypothetical protein SEA_ARCHIE_134 [Mycobacterium phage Archie]
MLAWQKQAQAIWNVVMVSIYCGGTPVIGFHPTQPPMFGVKLPED